MICGGTFIRPVNGLMQMPEKGGVHAVILRRSARRRNPVQADDNR
jgi:hypothetical protein